MVIIFLRLLIFVVLLTVFFTVAVPFFVRFTRGLIALLVLLNISRKVTILYQQGNYTAAIPLAQKAIKISRKALGYQNAYVAAYLNNLALLYESQGRYSEAEPLYKDAIAIVRIALPKNHPQLATHLNNLAALYRSQGRYSEAEPLYNEAIAIDRIALPKNHPELATTLNNLAALYYVLRANIPKHLTNFKPL